MNGDSPFGKLWAKIGPNFKYIAGVLILIWLVLTFSVLVNAN